MTTLVTGGAGFVGINLVESLLARGGRVIALDAGALPALAQRALSRHSDLLTVVQGNVLDRALMDDLLARYHVRQIVHCAAITPSAQRETRDPAGIVEVNLQGTISMLDAMRQHKLRRFIYVGSGAAYGETLYRLPRIDEEDASAPSNFYSITKYAAERLCGRLRDLWQTSVVCVRLGTVIGPWERATGTRDNYGTHTQLAGMAVRGELAVLTPREIQRDWVYARDVAAGILALLDADAPRHLSYNLSSGFVWDRAIVNWCEALKAAFPAFSYRVAGEGETPNIWYTDVDRGIMDVGRIAHDIGFRPRFGPRESYADYVAWLKATPAFFTASGV